MAIDPSINRSPLTGIAKRLVMQGALSDEMAIDARHEAAKNRIPLMSYLVSKKLVASKIVAEATAAEFGLPLLDLSVLDLAQMAPELHNEALIKKHRVLPIFQRGNRLFLALSDPTNLNALDEFKFSTGLTTDAVVVEEDKLNQTIDKILDNKANQGFKNFDDDGLDNLEVTGGDDNQDSSISANNDDEDAPVVKFVNAMLMTAIKRGVSDLHFEPYEKNYRVRFRIDGVLEEIASPPVNLAGRIAARLKVMSRLDIAERRIPQDGRIKLRISANRAIDFRVSTCPTLFGEKIVLRILDPTSTKLGIDVLGYADHQRELFLEAIAQPQGMVLVTGPTGSGKTVSLYTALNILNTAENNISTAEDPVEFNFQGINQVNVNPKAGLTFSSALRAFLRQDPDIIMVGEIRDLETASIAIKAAQTGHLVLSTLHTNNAPETLTRLINMGIEPYNIAGTVHLIIAQRLARKLCNHCKKAETLPPDVLIQAGYNEDEVHGLVTYSANGCSECSGGYKGRTGLYQVMPISDGIAKIMMRGGSSIEIAEQATREGVWDLRRSGLEKVKQGITTLAEVSRVTTE